MIIATMKFDKKKAVFWIIMAALVIVGIILLAGTGSPADSSRREKNPKAVTSVNTEKKRAAYLAQYGWEVETPAMKEETVLIPRSFSTVFENYNALQKEQGFDLSEYCGTEVRLYTYRVLNSDVGDNAVAMLYVLGGTVIGGDVHSTALDGFMCGIKR